MKRLRFLVMCLGLVVFFNINVWAAPQPAGPAKQQQFKPKEIKIDRNYDGVAERTEIYDEKGLVQRVEADSNNDGKIDEWVYYEKGVAVKGEKDLNKDAKADTAMIYDTKGVIIRTETDSNSDGKIDEWVYYVSGAPSRAEKDTNHDGKIDTWLSY